MSIVAVADMDIGWNWDFSTAGLKEETSVILTKANQQAVDDSSVLFA